jgi:hypothetical protein
MFFLCHAACVAISLCRILGLVLTNVIKFSIFHNRYVFNIDHISSTYFINSINTKFHENRLVISKFFLVDRQPDGLAVATNQVTSCGNDEENNQQNALIVSLINLLMSNYSNMFRPLS